MNYLITGGLGVIGSLISKRLIRDGHDVIVIDDGRDPRHEFNTPRGTYLVVNGRLEDIERNYLAGLVTRSDRILHAAASTGIPYSAEQPLDDWRRNVDGTIALLEAVRKHPKPTVVLSSVKPYGLKGLHGIERATRYELSGDGVDETFPLLPEEPYGSSKAAQSLVCMAYGQSFSLPITVFRCSNLYGPAACHGTRHGWLTAFCIWAALGRPIEIQGAGNQTRDMLFWSDVLEACEHAWAEGGVPGYYGQAFNLGGGRSNTISPLGAVAILRSLGATVETTSGPGRRHEDNLFVTNTAAYEAATTRGPGTGWAPRVNVEDGIAQIYEWACENRDELRRVYAP